MARVAERRVRFPAVEALAQAHVAPCVTGSAIARLPSPSAASASMRSRFGLALHGRKLAALPRGLVASVRSARSSRSPARGRRPRRMARRMRGRGGARRQHRAASPPQTQARRPAAERARAPATGTSARNGRTRPIPVEVRPVSGNEGRGRSESAWTPKRQGVKAISRLPNPRDARRNMRLRKSLDRRKPDAPLRHTRHPRATRHRTDFAHGG